MNRAKGIEQKSYCTARWQIAFRGNDIFTRWDYTPFCACIWRCIWWCIWWCIQVSPFFRLVALNSYLKLFPCLYTYLWRTKYWHVEDKYVLPRKDNATLGNKIGSVLIHYCSTHLLWWKNNGRRSDKVSDINVKYIVRYKCEMNGKIST